MKEAGFVSYRERDSNPHGAYAPTDFTYHYSFHCPACYTRVAGMFVVWTMPLPYPDVVET